jgi:aldehyde:ferredoxin oxidoreductase
MDGFFQKLLKINLNDPSSQQEELSAEMLMQTLGGKGLGARLLLEHNRAGVDPLSAENNLILATGPVSGTAVWGSCRYGVFTKSPQTGYFSESYSGGTTAEYMVKAGFDAVMIHGAADTPVWIEIGDQGIFFHSAQQIWGQETYATEDQIKGWIKENRPQAGKCGVICIGPAGENLVSFAVIENDYWRSAGRTGVGAVMGSKKIKAIAFWGGQKRPIADKNKVKTFAKEMAQHLKDHPGAMAYKKLGTPMMVDTMNAKGCFPTRYWQKGRAEHREGINAEALNERCEVVPHACLKCPMACGNLATVKEGRHKGLKIEGPEYETIYAFGGLCEVKDIEEIAYLNDVCDRLGMDTISAGNLAALTIEAKRQGRLDYDIAYGEVDRIAALLQDIANREGIGDLLARGIKTAAAHWHMEDQAIHVKGLEPAGYDPRVLKGMGLSYGTSPRGACHLRTTFYKPELTDMIDPDQIDGKAEMVVEWEDRLIIFDTLVLCRFYRDFYQWDRLITMIEAVTGIDVNQEKLRSIAAGISNDTRRFNLREGLTCEEDHLPKRFYREALPESGKSISQEQMSQLLADYYKARGWDAEGRI